MKKHYLQSLDLPDEPAPTESLIEIAGYRRVLIEHHYGVIAYCRDRICVKVKYGFVSVHGNNLELTRMTGKQVIVTGRIDSVQIRREERA